MSDSRTEVRSPTRTEVRSPTRTSTRAYTRGNFTSTVTGGAGAGETKVTINIPGRDTGMVYPIAMNLSGDTGGLTLEKLKPFYTTRAAAIPIGAAVLGALIGGKKHRALGATIGVVGVIGLLYVGSPLG